jgi:large conductance mechanosensitive channel
VPPIAVNLAAAAQRRYASCPPEEDIPSAACRSLGTIFEGRRRAASAHDTTMICLVIAEFRGFLTKTNALALAVGVIIGAAVGNVVSSLAADVLMPVIGLFLPGGDWRQAKYVLSSTTDTAGKVSESAILYGHFLGTLIDFIVISFVVFLIVKTLVKPVPAPAAQAMKACPECLEMVPAAARRCRACTAAIRVS